KLIVNAVVQEFIDAGNEIIVFIVRKHRSEERRVGKECRSRRAPYHYKKKAYSECVESQVRARNNNIDERLHPTGKKREKVRRRESRAEEEEKQQTRGGCEDTLKYNTKVW